MGLKDLPLVKKTVSIRRHKNPLYKKAFLPQRWDKMFQAHVAFRPRPTYLFTESAKIQKKQKLRAIPRRHKAVMASQNIDKEASVMRGRKRRAPRRKRGPKKQAYLVG